MRSQAWITIDLSLAPDDAVVNQVQSDVIVSSEATARLVGAPPHSRHSSRFSRRCYQHEVYIKYCRQQRDHLVARFTADSGSRVNLKVADAIEGRDCLAAVPYIRAQGSRALVDRLSSTFRAGAAHVTGSFHATVVSLCDPGYPRAALQSQTADACAHHASCDRYTGTGAG